jgi:thiol:disulfide interchange protein DsbD
MDFYNCYLCYSWFLSTWIFGAGALNALSTNVWFNIIFFVLLVVLLLLFLELLKLCCLIPGLIDSQADRGGIVGILFMALAVFLFLYRTYRRYAFSRSSIKGGIAPVIGMFGFSLALALPLCFCDVSGLVKLIA